MSFVLAANKADMPNKQIPLKDGEEIAKRVIFLVKISTKWYITSAVPSPIRTSPNSF
jgi:hypothetical protein